MKKLMTILLISCLVLLVSGVIFAADGPITFSNDPSQTASKSVDLSAQVFPYASITFGTPSALNFIGFQDEIVYGQVTFNIETNCDCWVRGIGTPFSKDYKNETYQIDTWYRTNPADGGSTAWVPANNVDPNAPDVTYPMGLSSGSVEYKGQLAAVSSQPAGTYSAQYTLIVWHPMNVN